MELGKIIRERRQLLGLTQTELANKIGLKSKTSICKIELGEDNLTTTNIAKFAEALETTPAELMGWNVNNENDKKVEILVETANRLDGEQIDYLIQIAKMFMEKKK